MRRGFHAPGRFFQKFCGQRGKKCPFTGARGAGWREAQEGQSPKKGTERVSLRGRDRGPLRPAVCGFPKTLRQRDSAKSMGHPRRDGLPAAPTRPGNQRKPVTGPRFRQSRQPTEEAMAQERPRQQKKRRAKASAFCPPRRTGRGGRSPAERPQTAGTSLGL